MRYCYRLTTTGENSSQTKHSCFWELQPGTCNKNPLEAAPESSVQSHTQQVSGALVVMSMNKHLENLSFRVCEKLGERVRFIPVVLDPNTANGWLRVSEDLTSVRHIDKKQKLPDNPERFSKCPVVLGYEGLGSGKHSWEVEVGDHPDWTIGLVKETVDRKREPCVTPEYGFWCLTQKSGKYTNGCGETITLQRNPQRITVKLDYDGGLVSFYDPEDMTHINTHKYTFTEKLHAFFLIGKPGDAKTTDIKLS